MSAALSFSYASDAERESEIGLMKVSTSHDTLPKLAFVLSVLVNSV